MPGWEDGDADAPGKHDSCCVWNRGLCDWREWEHIATQYRRSIRHVRRLLDDRSTDAGRKVGAGRRFDGDQHCLGRWNDFFWTVGDNEAYNVSTNKWSALTADATARNAACYGAISGQLYVAGGHTTAGVVGLLESFSATGNKWTPHASMTQSVIAPGSAV
ncbi:MAG TPA: hypothetical protein VFE61_15795, partial [Candidatus Sulfotelmatobacter sp.]|nr:hypothetical protein [Candidatus Sulfotelmatobacter sp.]